jgi:hypothetical protein
MNSARTFIERQAATNLLMADIALCRDGRECSARRPLSRKSIRGSAAAHGTLPDGRGSVSGAARVRVLWRLTGRRSPWGHAVCYRAATARERPVFAESALLPKWLRNSERYSPFRDRRPA